MDSSKWADFFTCLYESKGISGKSKVDRYIFENIDSNKLMESGNDRQILFESASYYITTLLKKMSEMRNFHIKELHIKDCIDEKKECSLQNDSFKAIISMLCKSKLTSLHLWGIDFRHENEADEEDSKENKASILKKALEDRVSESQRAKELDIRILRCRNMDKFSFLQWTKSESSKIKCLSITECNLTDEDFNVLLPILLSHAELKSVNLGNNRLSMKSLEKLKDNVEGFRKNNTHFYFNGNRSGDEYLKREEVNELFKDVDAIQISS